MRGIGHLSRGTRDTLTFAARLTLALKADPAGEKRLLVLDEPFTSLDPDPHGRCPPRSSAGSRTTADGRWCCSRRTRAGRCREAS